MDQENQLFRFLIDDVTEGVIITRNLLSRIKKLSREDIDKAVIKPNSPQLLDTNNEKKDMKNNIILINGKSFEIIKSNEYLLSHFCFFVHLSKGIIAFHMESLQKAELLSLIKNRVYENSITLSIGDGFDDLPMNQEADFAVEIGKIDENRIFNFNFRADLFIEDFDFLGNLIFANSKTFMKKIEDILAYLVYCSILMTSNYFYFFWYSHFNGFFFLENFQFFYQNTYQFLIPIIFYYLYKLFTIIMYF